MARNDEYQKWDYITLSDFTSSSCGTVFSYIWLWFLAIIGISVYGSDTYTAVNLLAFDKWSSTFQPIVPLKYSKWIFAGCILLSWALLGYEWIRAWRVIKRANVAESYLDPLAVNFQSMRPGATGQGWRRFLVFKELTKSKKGADYCALFCYFEFKGAIRVCLAEGPRQAINGLTLYSVMRASLIPLGTHAATGGHSPFVQFWLNVQVLYEASPEQAIVLFTMLFTFVIWVFSALSLLAAALAYVGFLWHYLPKMSLNKYCRKKVDKRLARIVNVKTKAALEKEEAQRIRDEEKLGDRPPGFGPPSRSATLPTIDESTSSIVPSMQRFNSMSTTVTASSERKPTLPDLGDLQEKPAYRSPSQRLGPPIRPGLPTRSTTMSSTVSVSSIGSDRPLLPSSQRVPPPMRPGMPNRAATMSSTVSVTTVGSDRPWSPDQREYTQLPQRQDRRPTPDHDMPAVVRKPLPQRSMTSESYEMRMGSSDRGPPRSNYAPFRPQM